MQCLVIVLIIFAGVAPVAGLLAAWWNARKLVREKQSLLAGLEAIQQKYQKLRKAPSANQEALYKEEEVELRRAGKGDFTYAQMDLAPHFVTVEIFEAVTRRLPLEIVLIVLGLLSGAAAGVISTL